MYVILTASFNKLCVIVVLLVSLLFTFECVSFTWEGICFLIKEFDRFILLLWKRWVYIFFPFSSHISSHISSQGFKDDSFLFNTLLFLFIFNECLCALCTPKGAKIMIWLFVSCLTTQKTPQVTSVTSTADIIPIPEVQAHAGEVEEREKKLGIKSALIPSGSFQMGCLKGDDDCYPHENPQHEVTLTKSFYMMTTEATQGMYKTVMGENPSEFSSCGDTCPLEMVSWYDAVRMSNTLNAYLGLESCYEIGSGEEPSVSWSNKECSGWRLPTEAEWEYAARGGEGYRYAGSNNMDEVAWYDDNSGSKTHPVGQKKANGYGLYDMNGNVFEWAWDSRKREYGSSVTDPIYADTSTPFRVRRGGSWDYFARDSRVSDRYGGDASYRSSNQGFRFLRTTP